MIDGAYLIRAMAAEWIGSGSVQLWTDLPTGLAYRETVTLPATTTQLSREFPLAGTTKGRSYSVLVSSSAEMALLRLALWVKRFGAESSEWTWVDVPLIPKADDEILEIHIDIPPTPSEWSQVQVDIPATPSEWSQFNIDVPPTPTEWSQVNIAIPPTPEAWEERQVPVPPSPEEQHWANLAMDE